MDLVKHKNSNGIFPSLMEELFRPDWAGGMQNLNNVNIPAVNIKETDYLFEIELSAPGRQKEDFSIDLDNDLLTISAEYQSENKSNDEKGKYTRREFSHASFRRSFSLPDTVKDEGITAVYENGILKINILKKEEALPKPKRFIEVL